MKKQPLSPQRATKIFSSLQFISVMAEMISIEQMVHMDVNFRSPTINNFAGRIERDAQAIKKHLSSVGFKEKDQEFTEEYVGELWRVFHLFIGMDIEKIREFMDGVDKLQQVEESEE